MNRLYQTAETPSTRRNPVNRLPWLCVWLPRAGRVTTPTFGTVSASTGAHIVCTLADQLIWVCAADLSRLQ